MRTDHVNRTAESRAGQSWAIIIQKERKEQFNDAFECFLWQLHPRMTVRLFVKRSCQAVHNVCSGQTRDLIHPVAVASVQPRTASKKYLELSGTHIPRQSCPLLRPNRVELHTDYQGFNLLPV
jgi:hypothetical protein